MKITINTFIALSFLLVGTVSFAAGNVKLDSVDIDVSDHESLQRGAKTFINYCMGCHSLSYQRYNRMADDIGINIDQLKENLIFTTDKNGKKSKDGALMKITMQKDYTEKAFGVAPPDLTVIARSNGTNWLYTYLRSFHKDEKSATGFANTVKIVSMPNVLWQLQGEQVLDKKTGKFSISKLGLQTPKEFDATIKDLVTFLSYTGEPIQQTRKTLGIWVLLFMLIFTIVAYFLKKEYWRDIH
ncbi:MAG: cytochrome c1 [Gammaproteobacteria bacterium]|nr:MAG: cytochrome c1 [Gammaproteobacteria bacterium]